MPTQAEVEEYRLTPEQMDFQKRYKRLKMVQSLLENETLKTQEKVKTLRSMWGELTGEFDKLQMNLPTEPVKELEGMEPGTAPAADRDWSEQASLSQDYQQSQQVPPEKQQLSY